MLHVFPGSICISKVQAVDPLKEGNGKKPKIKLIYYKLLFSFEGDREKRVGVCFHILSVKLPVIWSAF